VSVFTALAIYFVVWWVVLFAVLPWGVHRQDESGEIAPGTDPGAPSFPQLKRKMIWTTIVATIVFTAWYVAYTNQLVTLDQLSRWFGAPGI
jgi:predicted secreted protein